MLENIIQLEDKAHQVLNDTPWYVKLLFAPEVRQAQRGLDQMKQLRSSPVQDAGWFDQYAQATQQVYGAASMFVDEAYDLYETIRPIPIIGSIVDNKISSVLGQYIPISNTGNGSALPPKKLAHTLVGSAQNLHMEFLVQSASETLNIGEDTLRSRYASMVVQPQRQSYGLRNGVVNFASAVGDMLSYFSGSYQT